MAFLTWDQWVCSRGLAIAEHQDRKPDYSIDRWLKMATEFGDDVNKMVGHAEEQEKDIDKKKKEAETEPSQEKTQGKEEKQKPQEDKEKDDKEGEAWKSLKKIHQERLSKFQNELEKRNFGKSGEKETERS